MGNKLSLEQAAKSNSSAIKYKEQFGIQSYRNVIVKKHGDIIYNLNVIEVFSIPNYSGYHKVSISWEDCGIIDYKHAGLFGHYSCEYCKCIFENNTLTIFSDNDIVIEIK